MYICEICVTKKRPKINLWISVKSVGQNFHRISRINQRHSCLSDYSRIFADIWPLANGSRQICAAVVFWSRRFRRWRRFFFVGLFLSHRFHRFTQIFSNLRRIALSDPRGYLQRPNRSPLRNSVSNRRSRKSPNKFRVIR